MTETCQTIATRRNIPGVLRQHAEEAAILCGIRLHLWRAPDAKLLQLNRLDQRIAAHLDGLAIAGEAGMRLCDAALERPEPGTTFVAAVRALETRDVRRLDRLLALGETLAEARPGLATAFVWVAPEWLQGVIPALLESPSSFRRQLGLLACALHGADPGQALADAIGDDDPGLRAYALRVAGECGRLDLLGVCLAAETDADEASRFAGACSAVLLGDRWRSVQSLGRIAQTDAPGRAQAQGWLLRLLQPAQAAELLRRLSDEAEDLRALLRLVGMAGDPRFVPWLVEQMAQPALARLAGESFSLITGADLAALELECAAPDDANFGPVDDPADDNVAMDEDDGLPWPDPVRVRAWWSAHAPAFQSGLRYFMGGPPSAARCRQVLRDGWQRQRLVAAEHLCLLQPGTRLFPVGAPAWRQQRWLCDVDG